MADRARPKILRTDIEVRLSDDDMSRLAARADVLTPETQGLFDEAAFRRMKDTAYLVDVARGAIIDEAALVRALTERWIAGAGIDVFPVEPLTSDCPLFALDNVILTSHLAWYTTEADNRLADECMDRVLEILDGKRPRNLVNAEALGLT